MPREIDLFGLYAPTLLLIFIGSVVLQWLIDGLLGRLGVFGQLWHPALFRLSLFVCLFGGGALLVYR
jgi:hypothetical protein